MQMDFYTSLAIHFIAQIKEASHTLTQSRILTREYILLATGCWSVASNSAFTDKRRRRRRRRRRRQREKK